MNFETVCPTCESIKFFTCGSIKLFYSRMEPSGWFCEECGTPTALTQATLDLEEPGNWS